jgi:P27 family predicted phage terminase small subunit
MSKREIPKPPARTLKLLGRKTWERAWNSVIVNESDYDMVLLLCKLVDERKKYEDHIEENGDLIVINNNTNIIMHPYFKRIDILDKQIPQLMAQLGMTPEARFKMGVSVDIADEVDLFLKEFKDVNKNV